MDEASGEVTRLIQAVRLGEDGADARLVALIYDQILELARRQRRAGRYGETLQPTALANEVASGLIRAFPKPPKDQTECRQTLYRAVVQALRLVLRDYHRKKSAIKRGGGVAPVPVHAHDPAARAGAFERWHFLDLDAALERLEQEHPRWGQVIMHRHLLGCTIEETAKHLGLAASTVKIDETKAKGWLRMTLEGTSS